MGKLVILAALISVMNTLERKRNLAIGGTHTCEFTAMPSGICRRGIFLIGTRLHAMIFYTKTGIMIPNIKEIPVFKLFPAGLTRIDRKSTRLNSGHVSISYAVFCLKKKM